MPGFEPAFKAAVTFGGDWFSLDADGKHGRVNFRGIAKYVGFGLIAGNALGNMLQGQSREKRAGNLLMLTYVSRTEDGHVIDVRTFGIIDLVPAAAKVFTLQPDMASVPFGHAGMSCFVSALLVSPASCPNASRQASRVKGRKWFHPQLTLAGLHSGESRVPGLGSQVEVPGAQLHCGQRSDHH